MSRVDPVAALILVFAALVRGLFVGEVIAHGVDVRDRPNVDAYFYDYEARALVRDPLALRLDEPVPGRAPPGHREFAATVFGDGRVALLHGPRRTYPDYPGYAYFVAAHYALFGAGTPVVLVTQELLDLGTCLLVYLVARRLFDRTTARVALLLVAATGPLVFYAGFLLRDSAIAFASALVVHLAVRAREKGGTGAWLAAGLALGAAWVLKGSTLFLVPFVLPPVTRARGESGPERSRRVLRSGAALAGAAALAVLPFAARNVALGGPPFLMTTLEPPGVLVYNAPGAATRGLSFDMASARSLGERCPRIAVFPALATAIEAHPHVSGWLALVFGRLANVWIADDAWDNVRYSWLSGCFPALALAPVRWKLLAPFVALGLVLVLRTPQRVSPLLGPLAAVTAMTALGGCLTRYRLHADPEHAVLAAVAIVWLWREARKRRAHAIHAAQGVLALSVALHEPLPEERWRPTPERVRAYVLSTFSPGAARWLVERPR